MIEELNQRIKELEENLANIQTAQDKQNIQQEMNEMDKGALYIKKFNEGIDFWNNKNFSKALELFNEAVALKPNDDRGYNAARFTLI